MVKYSVRYRKFLLLGNIINNMILCKPHYSDINFPHFMHWVWIFPVAIEILRRIDQ